MAADDDAQARADELCALEAIYGEGFVRVLDEEPAAAPSALAVTLPEPGAQPCLQLRLHLPETYPSQHPPVFELACELLPPDVLASLAAELEAQFSSGEVVLWQWIEYLRERWPELAPQPAAASPDSDAALAANLQAAELLGADDGEEGGGGGGGARQRRQQEQADPEYEAALAEVASSVVHGEPLTERRSTFQAHVAPATSVRHVEALMDLLLQNNKIRAATHNIMAYRIEQAGKEGAFLQGLRRLPTLYTLVRQDHDEDGEQAAGGRLLHLLQVADARNVVVVVSRWYGGVLLGPSRFAIINNTARQLLEELGYIAGAGSGGKAGGGGKGKRR